MIDLFDDPDLFAPTPKPSRPPRPRIDTATPPPDPAFLGPRWPVASYACPCGARDEVKEPAPDCLKCWECKRHRMMLRIVPRYLPPRSGGRSLEG